MGPDPDQDPGQHTTITNQKVIVEDPAPHPIQDMKDLGQYQKEKAAIISKGIRQIEDLKVESQGRGP